VGSPVTVDRTLWLDVFDGNIGHSRYHSRGCSGDAIRNRTDLLRLERSWTIRRPRTRISVSSSAEEGYGGQLRLRGKRTEAKQVSYTSKAKDSKVGGQILGYMNRFFLTYKSQSFIKTLSNLQMTALSQETHSKPHVFNSDPRTDSFQVEDTYTSDERVRL
jgi:hypothetical protein